MAPPALLLLRAREGQQARVTAYLYYLSLQQHQVIKAEKNKNCSKCHSGLGNNSAPCVIISLNWRTSTCGKSGPRSPRHGNIHTRALTQRERREGHVIEARARDAERSRDAARLRAAIAAPAESGRSARTRIRARNPRKTERLRERGICARIDVGCRYVRDNPFCSRTFLLHAYRYRYTLTCAPHCLASWGH